MFFFALLDVNKLQKFIQIYSITSTDPPGSQILYNKMFSSDPRTEVTDWNVVPFFFEMPSNTLSSPSPSTSSISPSLSPFHNGVGILPVPGSVPVAKNPTNTVVQSNASSSLDASNKLNIINLPNFGNSQGITSFDILENAFYNKSIVSSSSSACTHLMEQSLGKKGKSEYTRYVVDQSTVSGIQAQIDAIHNSYNTKILIKKEDARDIYIKVKEIIKKGDYDYLSILYNYVTLFETYVRMSETDFSSISGSMTKEMVQIFRYSDALLQGIENMKGILEEITDEIDLEKRRKLIPYTLEVEKIANTGKGPGKGPGKGTIKKKGGSNHKKRKNDLS